MVPTTRIHVSPRRPRIFAPLASSFASIAFRAVAGAPTDDHDDDHKGGHGGQFAHFHAMFFTLMFVLSVWVAGKATAATGAPSLVGEIIIGVILGPNLVDFVPNPAVLKSIGEIGLCLHALEAGLMVDVELLEIIGSIPAPALPSPSGGRASPST